MNLHHSEHNKLVSGYDLNPQGYRASGELLSSAREPPALSTCFGLNNNRKSRDNDYHRNSQPKERVVYQGRRNTWRQEELRLLITPTTFNVDTHGYTVFSALIYSTPQCHNLHYGDS